MKKIFTRHVIDLDRPHLLLLSTFLAPRPRDWTPTLNPVSWARLLGRPAEAAIDTFLRTELIRKASKAETVIACLTPQALADLARTFGLPEDAQSIDVAGEFVKRATKAQYTQQCPVEMFCCTDLGRDLAEAFVENEDPASDPDHAAEEEHFVVRLRRIAATLATIGGAGIVGNRSDAIFEWGRHEIMHAQEANADGLPEKPALDPGRPAAAPAGPQARSGLKPRSPADRPHHSPPPAEHRGRHHATRDTRSSDHDHQRGDAPKNDHGHATGAANGPTSPTLMEKVTAWIAEHLHL